MIYLALDHTSYDNSQYMSSDTTRVSLYSATAHTAKKFSQAISIIHFILTSRVSVRINHAGTRSVNPQIYPQFGPLFHIGFGVDNIWSFHLSAGWCSIASSFVYCGNSQLYIAVYLRDVTPPTTLWKPIARRRVLRLELLYFYDVV